MKLDLESCLAASGEADLCSGVAVEHGLATCRQNMDTSVDNDYAAFHPPHALLHEVIKSVEFMQCKGNGCIE